VSDNGSVAAATWEQVELARHPDRPYALDYIHAIFSDFFELHGDRVFGDDHAIIGGPAPTGPVDVEAYNKKVAGYKGNEFWWMNQTGDWYINQ